MSNGSKGRGVTGKKSVDAHQKKNSHKNDANCIKEAKRNEGRGRKKKKHLAKGKVKTIAATFLSCN